MTTPSKAAMRAAEAIAREIYAVDDEPHDYTRDAEIIDREFAELVAVLREARSFIVGLRKAIVHNDPAMAREIARIDAALARVDSTNSA